MIRPLLLSFILVSSTAFGQITQTPVADGRADISARAPKSQGVQPELQSQPAAQREERRILPQSVQHRAGFGEMIIGNTQYDLQTNNSLKERVALSGNDVSAVWIQSLQVDPFTDRGSGYNSSADAGDNWGDLPSDRLESLRTGWTNIVRTANGREVVICHDFPTSLYQLHRDAGESSWVETSIETNVPQGVGWPSATAGGPDGNSIHMVYVTMTPAFQTDVPALDYEGMAWALLYSRSTDAGETWDLHEVLLDEINADFFRNVPLDGYAIHSRGDKVAFGIFNDFGDSVVMISEDNGDTWTKQTLVDFPVDLYDLVETTDIIDLDEDGVPDVIPSTGRAGAVFIDQDMHVHAAWGQMLVEDDLTGDDQFLFYPYTDGLAYWNDTMEENTSMDVSFVVDYDESGELELTDEYGGYGLAGLLTMPQFAQDAEGDLYISYSGTTESHATGTENYRHVYILKSEDGGETWSDPVDATPDEEYIGYECVYANMAHDVDDRLHIVYQRDDNPGNTFSANPDPVDLQDIVYLYVTSDLDITSVEEVDVDFEVFPNPASTEISIQADANLGMYSITDLSGRVVLRGNLSGLNAVLDIEGLHAGGYLLSVLTDKGIVSQRFIKE